MSSQLAATLDRPTGATVRDHAASLLRRFVQAYWLRPENAFWMALRSMVLSRTEWAIPAIDVACGDGIFTFLHCGGGFDPDFDVFQSVGHLDRVHSDHADMFDHADRAYAPTVTVPPRQMVGVGLDAKPALLKKAACLGLYEQLIEHDGNQRLPLDDARFQTVYCNAAYWIEDVDGFLEELRRIVHRDGRVILQVKLDSMRRYNLDGHRDELTERFLDIIGRGRLDCWVSLTDRKTWEGRFARAGLSVEEATPFITADHARIWDIGLRPIAPMLVRMANGLTPETRSSIKRDWVDLFCALLEPICRMDFSLSSTPDEPAEIQYVLSPSR